MTLSEPQTQIFTTGYRTQRSPPGPWNRTPQYRQWSQTTSPGPGNPDHLARTEDPNTVDRTSDSNTHDWTRTSIPTTGTSDPGTLEGTSDPGDPGRTANQVAHPRPDLPSKSSRPKSEPRPWTRVSLEDFGHRHPRSDHVLRQPYPDLGPRLTRHDLRPRRLHTPTSLTGP